MSVIKGSAMLFSAVCTNRLLQFFLSIQNILAGPVPNRAAADTFSTGQRLLRHFFHLPQATPIVQRCTAWGEGLKKKSSCFPAVILSFPWIFLGVVPLHNWFGLCCVSPREVTPHQELTNSQIVPTYPKGLVHVISVNGGSQQSLVRSAPLLFLIGFFPPIHSYHVMYWRASVLTL